MLIFYVLIPFPFPYPHPVFGKNPYPLRFRTMILKKTRSTFRSRTLILKMNPYPLRTRTYNLQSNPFPLRLRFRTWVRERNGYGIITRTPDSDSDCIATTLSIFSYGLWAASKLRTRVPFKYSSPLKHFFLG